MRINRQAYEQLITEDILALEKLRSVAISLNVRLELDHSIEVLRAAPDREYAGDEEAQQDDDEPSCSCDGYAGTVCGLHEPTGPAPDPYGHPVSDLPVSKTDDGQIISCWQMSIRERFSALLFGKIWFRTVGQTHAPIAISVNKKIWD